MKKIALLTAALLALSSVAASAQYGGPYYGKGKAPRRRRSLPKVEQGIEKGPAIVPVLYLFGHLQMRRGGSR